MPRRAPTSPRATTTANAKRPPSSPPALKVSVAGARRFVLHATGLDQPFASVGAALTHLGYVQIDPLNICGRMHDLILRPRVAGYREGDLMRHLHGEAEADTRSPAPDAPPRVAFEHHHPTTNILVAFPLEAWPHLLGAMQARTRLTSAWSGRLTPRERELVPQLLAEIAARGPLSSEDFADDRRAHRPVWGKASLVKSTLQKLFFHGRVLIGRRRNQRRLYDLPERVLPPAVLAQPAATLADTSRWVAELKLRQRRLAWLKRDERRGIDDLVQEVHIAGLPSLACLRDDVPLLQACDAAVRAPDAEPGAATPASAVRLLAPLDPVIYDRRVTAALWNFDYTWEAYTPVAKRVRGHYALPVLAGTELVGHVEPKADRAAGKLVVASRSVRRGCSTQGALRELAGWLGLRS
ncbi:crosslink repair DNA glycosylase YcaQ family protein [Opitutus sp. ER46]|uniref:DNA glycosylase AlkZ-like family protein n=1 Tax=Opitutus sp. ER46 TaxID=2161864 RepID=UPI001E2D8C60|nr:crosslink repair DNA glycosylase YcaQ family protein [Opitutus sp. ER46]